MNADSQQLVEIIPDSNVATDNCQIQLDDVTASPTTHQLIDQENSPDKNNLNSFPSQHDDQQPEIIVDSNDLSSVLSIPLINETQFLDPYPILIKRTLEFAYYVIGSIPVMIMFAIAAYESNRYFSSLSVKDAYEVDQKYAYFSPIPTIHPLKMIFDTLSVWAVFAAAGVGFIKGFNLKYSQSKRILSAILLHFAIQGVVRSLIYFVVPYSVAMASVSAYLLPLPVAYFAGYMAEKDLKEALGIVHPKKRFFRISFLVLAISTGGCFAFYQNLFISLFYHPSTSPFLRVLIRLVVHPLIADIATFPWRYFVLRFVRDLPEFQSKTHLELLTLSSQFIYALAGRILVATVQDFWIQMFISLLLSLQDVVFRTTLLYRDSYLMKWSGLGNLLPTQFYGHWMIYDEYAEGCGVIIAGLCVSLFNVVPFSNGASQPLYLIIILTIFALLTEVGSDFVRTWYYLRYFKSLKPKTTSRLSRLKHSSFVFWNSIEYWIHTSLESQSKDFRFFFATVVTMFSVFFLSLMCLKHLCGRLDLETGGINQFFCSPNH